MTTQRVFTSRSQHSATTYVGSKGQLFYNELTGNLRLSDGHTAGGLPISISANIVTTESIVPDTDNIYGIGTPELRWNHIHIGDGGIYFDGNQTSQAQTTPYIPGALTGSLVPATDNGVSLGNANHRFSNAYLGTQGLFLADSVTDANINIVATNGTLYLNGAQNLRVGNLVIVDTTLTSATSNLDISIGATNDTGFFYIKRKAQFDNVSFGSTEAMVSMNASGGADPSTVFPDTVLQTVSRPNKNSRVIQRAYGSSGNVGGDNSYAVWGSYAARGNTASPAALKANDILARISANGYGTTTWGSGGARVEFIALEDFTDTAKGTRINFWTTPEGQIASQNVASINSTGVVTAGVKFSNDSTVQTTAGIPLTAKAVSSATYVATLGIDGKLDATQIPTSLTGAIVFKGTWNANTNTPTLSNTLPAGVTTGWEYVVDVGGTRDIGDGSKLFASGDFVIFDGTHWKQVPSGNLFTSLTGGGHITVNQSTGAIVLGSDATPNSNTATIVSRDASGNFAANVITANLTGNVTGAVSGNAGSVTNGVYTTGNQSIDGTKTFTSTIQGTITSATYATSFNTGTLVANAVSATTATNAAYAYSFNTGTLVANAVTAQTVVGGIGVSSITAGTGTYISTSTGAVTIWVTTATSSAVSSITAGYGITVSTSTGAVTVNNLFTSTSTTQASTLTLDFTGPGVIFWKPSANANRAITLTGFTPGRSIKLWITPNNGANTFTFTGATAAQFSNNSITFTLGGGGTGQASMMIELFSTTSAIGGVWAFAYGGV
jgi:hypothetical protein